MTFSLFLRAVLLPALILGTAACHKPSPADASVGASPTPAADADPAEKPDSQGAVFGEGFYKEEAGAVAVIRWVRQSAAFRLNAPAEGRYRLTFRAFTVFSNAENTIDVSVNGQAAAGTFSAHAFDLAHPVSTTVEVPLRPGGNDVRLHSKGGETKLGEADDRTPAYGLVVPVMVERAP